MKRTTLTQGLSALLHRVIAPLLGRLGYQRQLPIPLVTQPDTFRLIDGGFIEFPIATDSLGRPIKFERGVSYIVGSNGRWRRRKTSAKPATVHSQVKPAETAQVGSASRWQGPTRKPQKTGYWEKSVNDRLHLHWQTMVASCCDPDHYRYSVMGARGAKVCDSWRTSFEQFRDDVLARGEPPKHKSLIRRDSSAPFGPDNFEFRGNRSGRPNRARKLSDEAVRHIRLSPQSNAGLAQMYKVDEGIVSAVRRGKTYTDVI
jgi:hypothetical protein